MAKSRWMTETRGAKQSELSDGCDDVKRLGKCLTHSTSSTDTHIQIEHTYRYILPTRICTDSFCFRTTRKSDQADHHINNNCARSSLFHCSALLLEHKQKFLFHHDYHKITSETTHTQTDHRNRSSSTAIYII